MSVKDKQLEHSIPVGGNTGQVLKKLSNTDHDYGWSNDIGEVNTASSVGTSTDGESLVTTKSGSDLRFKRIKAGANITLNVTANSIEIIGEASSGGSAEVTAIRRITTSNTNDVVLVCYGLASEIAAITAVKTNNEVVIGNVGSVKLLSIQSYFSGTDIGSNTNISILYPEHNGNTSLDQSLLPTVTRYQSNFNPFGTQAGSITNTAGVIKVTHSGGIVANNAATLKLVF